MTEATPVAAGGDRNTQFIFENKAFQLPEGYFSHIQGTVEPVFNVRLGDVWAKIPLSQMQQAFNIAPESADGALLDVVRKGLRFVKEIRPGDSIPREILDGTASWQVEERHGKIADGRLAAHILAWLKGTDADVKDRSLLERLTDDPGIRERMQNALTEVTRRVGLPDDQRQQVVEKVAGLGRELAYIEALRDRLSHVQGIQYKLNQAFKVYKSDRALQDQTLRMLALIKNPLLKYDDIFFQIDGQLSDIIGTVHTYAAQVAFIRQARDELHENLMIWDDLIDAWRTTQVVREPQVEGLIKMTYKFLAQNFLDPKVWQRTMA